MYTDTLHSSLSLRGRLWHWKCAHEALLCPLSFYSRMVGKAMLPVGEAAWRHWRVGGAGGWSCCCCRTTRLTSPWTKQSLEKHVGLKAPAAPRQLRRLPTFIWQAVAWANETKTVMEVQLKTLRLTRKEWVWVKSLSEDSKTLHHFMKLVGRVIGSLPQFYLFPSSNFPCSFFVSVFWPHSNHTGSQQRPAWANRSKRPGECVLNLQTYK